MQQENIVKALSYTADAVATGYTAVFTFGIKEILDTSERTAMSQMLQSLAANPALVDQLLTSQSNASQRNFSTAYSEVGDTVSRPH